MFKLPRIVLSDRILILSGMMPGNRCRSSFRILFQQGRFQMRIRGKAKKYTEGNTNPSRDKCYTEINLDERRTCSFRDEVESITVSLGLNAKFQGH